MPLIHVSERKLAANRANARKSTGPRTPAGKSISSRNACVHHAFARKHLLPIPWQEQCTAEAHRLSANTADPIRRNLEFEIAFHTLWSFHLDDAEDDILGACYQHQNGDQTLAYHEFFFSHAARAHQRFANRVGMKISRATRALDRLLNPQKPRRIGRPGSTTEAAQTAKAAYLAGQTAMLTQSLTPIYGPVVAASMAAIRAKTALIQMEGFNLCRRTPKTPAAPAPEIATRRDNPKPAQNQHPPPPLPPPYSHAPPSPPGPSSRPSPLKASAA